MMIRQTLPSRSSRRLPSSPATLRLSTISRPSTPRSTPPTTASIFGHFQYHIYMSLRYTNLHTLHHHCKLTTSTLLRYLLQGLPTNATCQIMPPKRQTAIRNDQSVKGRTTNTGKLGVKNVGRPMRPLRLADSLQASASSKNPTSAAQAVNLDHLIVLEGSVARINLSKDGD